MTRRLLVVDDEPDVRAVVSLSLEHVGGWQVVAAEGGLEGLDVARAGHLDAVVLDVMMPGTDGPATFRLLQADPRTADIPVVMLTARADRADRQTWLEMGVRAVLAKPFDPMDLPRQIGQVLGWPA